MFVHEIYEKYKDQREVIYSVYMDLLDETNLVRKRRDFAFSILHFIDMKHEIDHPSGVFEEVTNRIQQKIEARMLEVGKKNEPARDSHTSE